VHPREKSAAPRTTPRQHAGLLNNISNACPEDIFRRFQLSTASRSSEPVPPAALSTIPMETSDHPMKTISFWIIILFGGLRLIPNWGSG
jgi:hypothetical protein